MHKVVARIPKHEAFELDITNEDSVGEFFKRFEFDEVRNTEHHGNEGQYVVYSQEKRLRLNIRWEQSSWRTLIHVVVRPNSNFIGWAFKDVILLHENNQKPSLAAASVAWTD